MASLVTFCSAMIQTWWYIFPVHTSTVAQFPSQTVSLHSSKVGTGVLEKCWALSFKIFSASHPERRPPFSILVVFRSLLRLTSFFLLHEKQIVFCMSFSLSLIFLEGWLCLLVSENEGRSNLLSSRSFLSRYEKQTLILVFLSFIQSAAWSISKRHFQRIQQLP